MLTANGSPVGLDASLGWFAMEFSNDDLNNDLVIYQVPAAASGPAPRDGRCIRCGIGDLA